MALDGIKQKIDGHEYKTLQDFEDDFDLMFANAKQYNTEGSGVYLDAEELQVCIYSPKSMLSSLF